MKTLKEVCKKLEDNIDDVYESVKAWKFDGQIYRPILTHKRFEEVMMADGWILSDRTVEQKWKLLERNGILTPVPYSNDRAFFEVGAFAKVMEYPQYAREKKTKTFSADAPSMSEVKE